MYLVEHSGLHQRGARGLLAPNAWPRLHRLQAVDTHKESLNECAVETCACEMEGWHAFFYASKTSAPLLKIVLELLVCELMWVVKVCGCSAKALEGDLSVSACAHILPF